MTPSRLCTRLRCASSGWRSEWASLTSELTDLAGTVVTVTAIRSSSRVAANGSTASNSTTMPTACPVHQGPIILGTLLIRYLL